MNDMTEAPKVETKPQYQLGIRPLAPFYDYPQICELARTAYVQECAGAGRPEPVWPDAYKHILHLCETGFGWVATANGHVIGMMMIVEVIEPHNSKVPFLKSAHYWVMPQFRSKGVAVKLLDAAKEFAAERGQGLMIASNMGKAPKAVDAYFERNGGQYIGGSFWFPLDEDEELESQSEM